jgi:MFS family permease
MQGFKRLLSISSFTQLADELVSAKIILPWIFLTLNAPIWMLSLLVPIKESGSLLPQWSVKQALRSRYQTGLIWRSGMILQGASLGLLLTVLLLPIAGRSVIGLFSVVLLSVGRALCSFTVKDIQAHNIAKGERGKLIGLGGSISGLLTIVVSVYLLQLQDIAHKIPILTGLLIGGFTCYAIGCWLSISLSMPTGLESSKQGSLLQFWRQTPLLRKIVYQRSAVLHGALVMPYMVLAVASEQAVYSSLPWFMLGGAIASFLSSAVWGILSDDSARHTMQKAIAMTLLGAFGFYLIWYCELTSIWLMMLCFAVANLGYAGVRTARKTYLLDIVESDIRQQYVASGNTLVGLVLLGLGALYAVLYSVLSTHLILICVAMLLVGAWITSRMPKEK